MEQETKQEQEKGINITYETLFDILRNEKTRESLQKLDKAFYTDIKNYLLEKNTLLEGQKKGSDLFSASERDKTEKQLINARRIIKEIYDRREKKIISMALNKSRIASNLIDTSVLLEEERKAFNQIVELLKSYRINILLNTMEGREPVSPEAKPETKPEEKEEEGQENKQEDKPGDKQSEVQQENKQEDKEHEDQQEDKEKDSSKKPIKFTKPVQRFMGKELEVYGPFEEGDTAELPAEIVELLIDKGNAEETEE
ncbi:hypothetical protein CMO89_01620 [Candidatus Woesearchaeota archaeon]|nr:hypothetical protein [Candidatus Woesearchaeota archaeon]|tara:strand:+ start:3492 stop:4259 length:768 start_codon:yes stop_codon:yes gene_type:complete